MATPLVPAFFARLARMGIQQSQIARLLGCSPSLVSRMSSGERSLPLADLEGLLRQLTRLHPELRAEIAEAALGPLLDTLGCRIVAAPTPPPQPAGGVLIDLTAERASRAGRPQPVRLDRFVA